MNNKMKKKYLFLIGILMGGVTGAGIAFQTALKDIIKWKRLSDKHLELFLLMNQWVQIKQEGKNLAEYLIKYNFKTIALYGMSYIGERVIEELKDSEVKIAYGIDKNSAKIYTDIEVVNPDDVSEGVDAVIVTSIFFINEIEKELGTKLSCPIISLENILSEL